MALTAFRRARRYIIVFVLVFMLALFFPPSADDLGWATSQGEALFKSGFADYNGRYLGNMAALVLTRLPAFCLAAVKAAVLVAILWLLMHLSRSPSPKLFWTATTLFLIPSPLFAQGFIWTAGFSNYYLSLLVTLLSAYLLVLCRRWRGAKAVGRAAVLAALGFAGQLFMETFTLFCLLGAVTVLVWLWIRDRRPNVGAVLYLLACVAGTVLMFTNGIYRTLFTGGSTSYQALEHQDGTLLDKAFGMVQTMFGNVSLQMIFACFPAILVIVFLTLKLMCRTKTMPCVAKAIVTVCWLLSLACLVTDVVLKIQVSTIEYPCAFDGLFLLFIAVAVGITVAYCAPSAGKCRVIVYAVLLLVFTAPLCVVFPIGPRCYNGAFALLILMIGELYAALSLQGASARCRPALIMLAVVMALDLACYITVFAANEQKVAVVRERAAAGDTVVELPHTMLYFMVYGLDVEDRAEHFMARYCEYYDIPQTIKIVYVK